MKFGTETAATHAGQKLDSFLERVEKDTAEVLAQGDIPTTVKHFAEFRATVRSLAEKITALQKHVDQLSYEAIPTMFGNQGVKSIRVDDVGRVQINDRWSASMVSRETGMAWLRSTGNDGLIVETCNASTLGAWAKEKTLAGDPPPAEIFKVAATPYVSISKG
jgi:hypothetical protein